MRLGDRKDQEWLAETSVLVLSATNQVRKILGESVYDAYFKRMELESFDGSSVRLSVATKFQRKYIVDNYINILTEIWRNLANDSSVQIVVEVRGTTIAKPVESAPVSDKKSADEECVSEQIELTAEESELQSISLADKFWKEPLKSRLTDIVKSIEQEDGISYTQREQNLLKLIRKREEDAVNITLIQKMVCKRYGIKFDYLKKSRAKFRRITWPRQIAVYLCREHTDYSLPEIGRMFGNMDHSTIKYAHSKVKRMVSEGGNWFAEQIEYFNDVLAK